MSAATTRPGSGEIDSIEFSPFVIDRRGGRLTRGGETVPLRPKTWAVLLHLATHPGALVTKEDLLDAVWPGVAVTPDTLTKSIGELRVALGDDSRNPRFLETVHRRGFRFLAKTRTVDSPHPGTRVAADDPAIRDQPPASSFLVGRETELKRLTSCFSRAQTGDRQVVFITGAAGIGKTSLLEAFLGSPALRDAAGSVRTGSGVCVEQHGAREPYMPVLEALDRVTRGPDTERVVALLRHVAPTWLAQMPWLIGDDVEDVRRSVQGAKAERMLREFAAFTEALSEKTTLVIALEDLHYSDPSTVDLLAVLGQRRERARLMIVATYRPAEAAIHDHPLSRTVATLKLRRQCTDVPVHELEPAQVQSFLERRFPGAPFAATLAGVLHRHTDGNPLFISALVDHIIGRGWILDTDPGWAAAVELDEVDLGIPEDVRQMVVTQLEMLSPADRELLDTASVGGVEFAVQAVAKAMGCPAAAVEARCEKMARAHRFLRTAGNTEWPDDTVARRYAFTHELYRQAVYLEIPDGRRRDLHQRIGEALEAAYDGRTAEMASVLAMHFERSRDHMRALRYLAAAARRARGRFAPQEAIGHLEAAISEAAQLRDDEERLRQELELRLDLSPVLSDRHGFASERQVENATRAYELCSRVGTKAQLFPIVYALGHIHTVRCDTVLAPQKAAELSALADTLAADTYRLVADSLQMRNAVHAGRFAEARRLAAGRLSVDELPSPLPFSFGADPLSAVKCHDAYSCWMLGHTEEARAIVSAAVTRAERRDSPVTLIAAVWFNSLIEVFSRNPEEADPLAERCVALAREHGFAFWYAMASALKAWGRLQAGELRQGIRDLEEARAAHAATRAVLFSTHILAFLAEGHLHAGTFAAGLAAADEGLAIAEATRDRSYWPELCRLKGELLLSAGPPPGDDGSTDGDAGARRQEAEQCLLRALDLSRQSGAKSLELRAATSLARVRLGQGRPAEARRLLHDVHRWFGSESDSPDLAEARDLLAELPGTRSKNARRRSGVRDRGVISAKLRKTFRT